VTPDDIPSVTPRSEHAAGPLMVPLLACKSQGGPYDDASFCAGLVAGEVRTALTAAAVLGLDRASWTIPTALVTYLELVAMERGFHGFITVVDDRMPEWTHVSITVPAEVNHAR
jgi:hypothetical protein